MNPGYLTDVVPYRRALQDFIRLFPEFGWFLDNAPKGQAYYFPRWDGYCCIQMTPDKVAWVRGAFKVDPYSKPGTTTESFAGDIVALCEQLGAKQSSLITYAPSCKVWRSAGFSTSHRVPFNAEYAPSTWHPGYGKPDVVYMEKYCGN